MGMLLRSIVVAVYLITQKAITHLKRRSDIRGGKRRKES